MIYQRLPIFEKILSYMRKSLLTVLVFIGVQTVIGVQTLMAQNIAVAKLRSETSRTIKKDNDTSYYNWKQGGMYNFNLSQSSLSNWAAGGDNFNMAINSYFNYFAYFQKPRQSWDNNLDLNLGFVQSTSLGGRKNDDRIDILSKYGYRIDTTGMWYLSGLFNFRSQFFDGYSFSGSNSNFTSSFLSPAYIILSAGLDFKPNNTFSVFFSPLTSRTTLVLNTIQKKLQIAVIRYSSIKFLKTGILEDLALLTHSNYIDSNLESGEGEGFFRIQDLGQAKKVKIQKNKSTFFISKFEYNSKIFRF
jgi:hypothetical protein